MNLKREQEFVSQYHFDARNFEWENENGAPETKVDVNFQLLQYDQDMLNRLTYEVTEIALDLPGINLEF